MDQVERVGISIEPALLAEFDELIRRRGYPNRSEAVRDLIRRELAQERLEQPQAQAAGGVFLVYDHHTTRLSQKLIELQHSHLLHVISSLHVHLDHHNCMEVIVLQGRVLDIQQLADRLGSLKGVKLSRLNLITNPTDHEPHTHAQGECKCQNEKRLPSS